MLSDSSYRFLLVNFWLSHKIYIEVNKIIFNVFLSHDYLPLSIFQFIDVVGMYYFNSGLMEELRATLPFFEPMNLRLLTPKEFLLRIFFVVY